MKSSKKSKAPQINRNQEGALVKKLAMRLG